MRSSVLQVNISRGGVPKRAVERAWLAPLGLEGDGHAHPQIHGGPLQAVLLIARETVDALVDRGYPLFYGALGENLTTAGLDPRTLRAGQRYRIGEQVLIELTKPRAPCSTLDVYGSSLRHEIWDRAMKSGDPSSPHWGMSGFYASVAAGGLIVAGAPVTLVEAAC
jgi:MOSC domain-containing protein YiiM